MLTVLEQSGVCLRFRIMVCRKVKVVSWVYSHVRFFTPNLCKLISRCACNDGQRERSAVCKYSCKHCMRAQGTCLRANICRDLMMICCRGSAAAVRRAPSERYLS